MTIPPVTEAPPLTQDEEDGVIRIAHTRIPLERVVRAFLSGATPEQIVQDFDVLRLEDVYAVISYYLHHQKEVQNYLDQSEEESVQSRRTAGQTADLRARLLARQRRPA